MQNSGSKPHTFLRYYIPNLYLHPHPQHTYTANQLLNGLSTHVHHYYYYTYIYEYRNIQRNKERWAIFLGLCVCECAKIVLEIVRLCRGENVKNGGEHSTSRKLLVVYWQLFSFLPNIYEYLHIITIAFKLIPNRWTFYMYSLRIYCICIGQTYRLEETVWCTFDDRYVREQCGNFRLLFCVLMNVLIYIQQPGDDWWDAKHSPHTHTILLSHRASFFRYSLQ